MDLRLMGMDHPFFITFYDIFKDEDEDDDNNESHKNKSKHARSYVRDAKAMTRTPADVKEYPTRTCLWWTCLD